MTEPSEAAAAPPTITQPQQAAAEQPSRLTAALASFSRMILIYFLIQWFFRGGPQTSSGSNGPNSPSTTGESSVSSCVWALGTRMELRVYLSEDEERHAAVKSAPLLHRGGLVFGAWNEDDGGIASATFNVTLGDKVTHNNGSLYAHLLISREDASSAQLPVNAIYKRILLTRYLPKRVESNKRNLLVGVDASPNASQPVQRDTDDDSLILSYWQSNITVNIIADASTLPLAQIRQVPALFRNIQFKSLQPNAAAQHYPVVYVNDFWQTKGDLYSRPINDSLQHWPLHINFSPLSMWRFQLMVQMEESFRLQTSLFGGGTAGETEIDQIKEMLFETNPYLLVLTFTVSLLHSIFDILAFKNDIQFWKERRSMEGISVRTILSNVGLQSIILLYLMDSGETSWLIVVSSAVGLAIEIWKLRKALSVKLDRSVRGGPFGLLPFQVRLVDRQPASAIRQQTDEYDAVAFKYLGRSLVPLVLGYSVYSLVYETHKSWYSWLLGTAVGFVYTFGFIMMTPQLFINYKLRSVAHMPWRTFMYKALNTFVDDLFAFIIKMPLLHRLACFRDDLVFLVYLYQRYKYPVDPTRSNEYGQTGVGAETSAPIEPLSDGQAEAEKESKKTK